MSQRNNEVQLSRTWLIASGIFFLLVGFAAMALPVLFTAIIVKTLAIFILVSGVISLVMALIGKHKNYLLLEILSGIGSPPSISRGVTIVRDMMIGRV